MTDGAIKCARPGCRDEDGGHPYAAHEYLTHRCLVADCDCPGFLWVHPDGPHVGSYNDPPRRP